MMARDCVLDKWREQVSNEFLPFGGPREKRSRNTKRRVSWRNYPFAYKSVWQMFDEKRDVWIGPAPIAQIRAFRQQLYEHRYLIAEAADLGDVEAQDMMTLVRDAYTQITDVDGAPLPAQRQRAKDTQAKLHIMPNPAIALVNEAFERAGMYGVDSSKQLSKEQKEKIEEIRKQLDRAP